MVIVTVLQREDHQLHACNIYGTTRLVLTLMATAIAVRVPRTSPSFNEPVPLPPLMGSIITTRHVNAPQVQQQVIVPPSISSCRYEKTVDFQLPGRCKNVMVRILQQDSRFKRLFLLIPPCKYTLIFTRWHKIIINDSILGLHTYISIYIKLRPRLMLRTLVNTLTSTSYKCNTHETEEVIGWLRN
jgi:hypothetical protein